MPRPEQRKQEAERIIAEAHQRAAAVPFPGVRVSMIRAAERKAAKLLADALPEAAGNAPTLVKRDTRGLDGERRVTQRRPCLRCRRAFDSHGPGNRMCSACREKGSDASPYAV